MAIVSTLAAVTERIVKRSKPTREAYLARIRAAMQPRPRRADMGCSNLAHGMAACGPAEKARITGNRGMPQIRVECGALPNMDPCGYNAQWSQCSERACCSHC